MASTQSRMASLRVSCSHRRGTLVPALRRPGRAMGSSPGPVSSGSGSIGLVPAFGDDLGDRPVGGTEFEGAGAGLGEDGAAGRLDLLGIAGLIVGLDAPMM